MPRFVATGMSALVLAFVASGDPSPGGDGRWIPAQDPQPRSTRSGPAREAAARQDPGRQEPTRQDPTRQDPDRPATTRTRPRRAPQGPPRPPSVRGEGGQPPATRGTLAPPLPPPDAASLSPVQEPIDTVVPVPRDDLQRRPAPESPLVGVWRLVRLSGADGNEVAGDLVDGWMSINRKHLFVHLSILQPGRRAVALLQSGVYTWAERDDVLVLTTRSQHRGNEGRLVVDPSGEIQRRRVDRTGSRLRLSRTRTEWMEFVRIE